MIRHQRLPGCFDISKRSQHAGGSSAHCDLNSLRRQVTIIEKQATSRYSAVEIFFEENWQIDQLLFVPGRFFTQDSLRDAVWPRYGHSRQIPAHAVAGRFQIVSLAVDIVRSFTTLGENIEPRRANALIDLDHSIRQSGGVANISLAQTALSFCEQAEPLPV